MDFIHKLMNIVLPRVMLIVLLLCLPPYLVFTFLSYLKRSIFTEDVAGKTVLITGASSGIGEHIAYEYARRGARLALVARRKDQLEAVAKKTCELGSPDVLVISADVSNLHDCKRFVDETVKHFGQRRHNQLARDIENRSWITIDTNFWGVIYATYFAIPHLRKNKGKIIVTASYAGRFPLPGTSIYNASKAALISFYETLRCEIGSDIGITIVTPGFINTEMTRNQLFIKSMALPFVESSEECGKAIVKSSCRGDKYLVEPSWVKFISPLMLLCPELVEYFTRILFRTCLKNFRHVTEQKTV
ncbi:11-beta-hydroxysteroid dehydrogenase-like 2 [Carica papaya]|uniref:11-beta-hydroxysteroid dehydrogenase-like 2 n=1 Tax=Carica papaya TaxID=3649 RepID=UPI000B8CA469|nr:11-beta-hydroxysteroid dehydrogenase-like 2 [Carica papaya]